MGSCVSIHKDPESAVELRLSVGCKNDKFLMASDVKHELDTVNGGDRAVADFAAKSELSSRFRDAAGSKDDAFFDSQPWLESDCEDDFLSVNGDFTPSRGSTPVHHKFSSGNPTVNNAQVMEQTIGSVTEPSNPDKKKRLSELFKESLRRQHYADEENGAIENAKPEATTLDQSKSTNGIEAKSTGSGEEETPDRVIRAEDESAKSPQCCLPSFSERKKKMSPVLRNG